MRRGVLVSTACLVAMMAWAPPAVAQVSLWGELGAGKYGVGFRAFLLDAKKGSAIGTQVFLWYPAAVKESPRMTYAGYLRMSDDLEADPKNFATDDDSLRRTLAVLVSGKEERVPRATLDSILQARMSGSRDAETLSGRFPLVLWTPRYGVTAYQTVLCEFLASRGYVVAFARPAGARYPLPYEPKDAAAKQEVLRREVTDTRAALDKLEALPNVDRSKVAVIGWSYAGESATLLQMSDPTIRLVIGLSANLLTGQGYWTAEEATKLDAAKLNVPYVVLTESIATNGERHARPQILDRTVAESDFVEFPELRHGNFNMLEGMIPGILKLTEVQPWSRGGETAKTG